MKSATSLTRPGRKSALTRVPGETGRHLWGYCRRDDHDVVHAAPAQLTDYLRIEVVVSADRQLSPTTSGCSSTAALAIMAGLSETGVDDLHALVPEAHRHHLRTPVVAIEAGLGDKHFDAFLGIQFIMLL